MVTSLQKLKRIKTQLQGSAAAAVEAPFEVKCECGATVRGIRRATWIEAECPDCCQSVFVLPSNVYPATRSVPSEVLGGSFSERLKVVIGELLPARSRKSVEAADDTKSDADTSQSPVVPQPVAVRRRRSMPRLPRIDFKGLLVRTFTPFRLLMLSMLTVVGLTGYWMTWQQQVEAARQTWLKTSEQVEQHLSDSSDMIGLEATLRQAVDAGYTLGKNDPDWKWKRNLLQETIAVNSMAPLDLLNAFHDAYGDRNTLTDEAEQDVSTVAKSGTFVFDTYLQERSDQKGVFQLEFPATPGRHAVEIFLALPELTELASQIGDDRILFAAGIAAVQAPKQRTRQPWRLLIDPESFVLMTSPAHCQAIGISPDDDPELQNILQRQQEFVESSDSWEHRAETVILPHEFEPQKAAP